MSEFVKNKFKDFASKDTAFNIFTSPTFVWFFSLYISGLLMMIGFNIARLGFTLDGIFGGPQYYAKLFLQYGLNATSEYASPWFGASAWIFAPFMALLLGIPLFFLTEGGFSYNGVVSDPQGTIFYAFFKDDVFAYDINLFGDKGNLFFIGIVWIPIIVASVNTILVKKKYDNELALPKLMLMQKL